MSTTNTDRRGFPLEQQVVTDAELFPPAPRLPCGISAKDVTHPRVETPMDAWLYACGWNDCILAALQMIESTDGRKAQLFGWTLESGDIPTGAGPFASEEDARIAANIRNKTWPKTMKPLRPMPLFSFCAHHNAD